MSSASLRRWSGERCAALDEIEGAHQSIGGSGRGRRYATQQINYAYAVIVLSHFQGFCRDLHSESADILLRGITPDELRSALRNVLLQGRRLDQGNADPGSIGSDFNRFGLVFWEEVARLDLRNRSRQSQLDNLRLWRNAIAHQDFTRIPGGSRLRLQRVRIWRRACDQLATAFDEIMRQHLQRINNVNPW